MKHIDPSEINIINYLTGEMTIEELKQFKLQLDDNQLLREQVEEMRNVQTEMSLWKNEDINIPSFESLSSNSDISDIKPTYKFKKFLLPNWMKYAAAFIGFVLLMQITGFKVSQNGNALLLSFGEPNSQSLDAQDVDEIVAKAINKYASQQNSQLNTLKNQLDSDLSKISMAVDNISLKHDSNLSQFESMVDRNMDKQYVSLESMIKGIEDNQRQELEDSFTSFVEYIDNKRSKDQYKIQNAFSEIATAINNQQDQTNALFTSISDVDPGLKSY